MFAIITLEVDAVMSQLSENIKDVNSLIKNNAEKLGIGNSAFWHPAKNIKSTIWGECTWSGNPTQTFLVHGGIKNGKIKVIP